jgi:hypothetical protein
MHRRLVRLALAAATVLALVPASGLASTWTLQSAVNPGGTNASLLGVSCPTASWCTAVGTSDATGVGGDIAETWNNPTWSLDSVIVNPERKNAALNGVSCPLQNVCYAAGYFGSFAGKQEAQVQYKSGTSTWFLTSRSGEPTHSASALYGISCVSFSITLCEAVGTHNVGGVAAASAFHGTTAGTAYDSSVIGNPGDSNGFLQGISCPASAVPYQCFAAGQYSNRSRSFNMIQVKRQVTGQPPENGPWSLAGAPNWSTGNIYGSAISCTSASFCMSVGRVERAAVGFDSEPVGLLYNGSTWSLLGANVPAGGAPVNTRFLGVSCNLTTTAPVRTICNAVGSTKNASGQIVALAERWDSSTGTWANLTTPTPVGSTTSTLNGVSCSAVDTCTAVGSYNAGSGNKPLALRLTP